MTYEKDLEVQNEKLMYEIVTQCNHIESHEEFILEVQKFLNKMHGYWQSKIDTNVRGVGLGYAQTNTDKCVNLLASLDMLLLDDQGEYYGSCAKKLLDEQRLLIEGSKDECTTDKG